MEVKKYERISPFSFVAFVPIDNVFYDEKTQTLII